MKKNAIKKFFALVCILVIASLFTTSTALATGTEPYGPYTISPFGGNSPQSIAFSASQNKAHYSYRAYAYCVVGSSSKTIYGPWESGINHISQTPTCSSKLAGSDISNAGYYYDKNNPNQQVCYYKGDPDSGNCL